MNPNNWLIVFYFIAIATCLSLSYGWLVKYEKLPFNSIVNFNDAQWQFLKIWVKVALLLGVIVPVIFLIIFWNELILRQFFSYYLLVVVVQLASESSFSRILCQSVVVIIGTLYTGFRIWQLWFGLHLVTYPQPWLVLLWLVFLYWVANIIMLFTIAIPNILPQTNRGGVGDR
jgi:hypothetical protein